MRQIAYKHYVLVLLMIVLIFNLVDRVALGIVLEDIKVDLSLSDTDLGLLGGIAFALFYSLMGIPIARWADRGNRVFIIAATAVLWSVAVALCGMAATFGQLLLIRVAVAVGEAGCVPPALSLIATYFTRAERPWATAIYGMGGGLAALIGFFLAGWLNELYGWRQTFMVLGLPGLALAAVAWATLKEPRLPAEAWRAATIEETPTRHPNLTEVAQVLWGNRTFRHLLLSLSVNFFFAYGILQWIPAFFIRSFGLTTGYIGTALAMVYGIASIIGTFLWAELARRYAANNERLQLGAMSIAIVSSAVLYIFVFVSPSAYLSFGLLALVNLGLVSVNGPLISTIQTVVPERMCAMAFALVYLVANLIGMGLGPLAVGALSDTLRPLVGTESLRYALGIFAPGYLWAAWHAWQASNTVTADIAALDSRNRAASEVQEDRRIRQKSAA